MRNKKIPWRPFSKKVKKAQGPKKTHVPFRLDFLFFIVFVLFTALVVRLSYLQINQHDEFVQIVEKGQKSVIEENAPRGFIYDSKGKVLVGNKANQAILYTRSSGMTAEDIKKVFTRKDAIEADKEAFRLYSNNKAEVPLRTNIDIPKYKGSSLFMPAYVEELDTAGIKIVSVFPQNVKLGKLAVPAQMILLDGKTGEVSAIMDGTYLTQLRT